MSDEFNPFDDGEHRHRTTPPGFELQSPVRDWRPNWSARALGLVVATALISALMWWIHG